MRIVFASLGAYGHLYPMLPLALACQEAGHTVTVATGPPFLDQLTLPTLAGYPSALTLGWAEQETRDGTQTCTDPSSLSPCSARSPPEPRCRP